MSTSPTPSLLPQSFWFRTAIPCHRMDTLPGGAKPNGRLFELPASCALPDLASLDGREAWAEVRLAWNPSGIAATVEVKRAGTSGIRLDQYDDRTQVFFWIDTRDTRDVHRATRFCHLFLATFPVERRRGTSPVTVKTLAINRALGNPPNSDLSEVASRAERTRDGWRLELFLPSAALHGFDPDVNRRLGFAYQVSDPEIGSQFLGVGREFPIAEDPSLWATLELRDEA